MFRLPIGAPLLGSLMFVHNALIGFSLWDRMRVFASGKVISALGADACYSARGMMLALGCIEALSCNTNKCAVGVTAQDSNLVVGLVPAESW